jgi:hypothetical protein
MSFPRPMVKVMPWPLSEGREVCRVM